MYTINLTKEELDASILQIGARIDALRELQKKEARNENIKRVVEIEEFLKTIISARDKMMEERYKS